MSQGFLNNVLAAEEFSQDTVAYRKVYGIIAGGDAITALVLSQIVYWNLPDKNGRDSKLRVFSDGKYWLAKRFSDWEEEILVSRKQATRAIKQLEDAGIIKTKMKRFNGSPMTHIWLDQDRLTFLVNKYYLEQRQERECAKGTSGMDERNTPDEQNGHPLTKTTTETTTETTNIMATALPHYRVNKTIGWIATNIFGEANYKGEFQWEELEEVQEWMGRVLAESRYKETLVELERLAAEGLTFKEAIEELLEPR